MDRYVLVTGGAGYVGSHANKLLATEGYKTVVLDNLVNGHRDLVHWGTLVEGNVGNSSLLKELFEEYNFSAVVHFAAYAYVEESSSDPIKYWKNNVSTTLNLLKQCVESGVENFVFSSTCTTYGIPNAIPISEEHDQNPVNPYGSSKLAVERMLDDFSNAYNLRYVSLRYFNAAGADPDCEIGENHVPETHLIPLVLDAALGRSECISVFGTDYPTDDGTCVRDYIHVTDLADAHVRALRYLEKGNVSRAFNLGNGTGVSVKSVIESVQRTTGCNIRIRNKPRRTGDPPILIADTQLAKSILNWNPVYKDLDIIVQTAWDWHRKKCSES